MIAAAVLGPILYPVDPNYQNYTAINAWPSAAHPLGTDSLGRDTLARILAGLRVSLIVVFYVELLNIGVGATLGLIAGFRGGAVDNVISRIADMLFAFPGLLFAILVAAVFGAAVTERFGGIGRLLLVAGSLALVSWPLMARYVRGQTLALKERDFVLAARSIGADERRLMWGHILPGVMGLIIVSATLDVAAVVVNEAVLSLLGPGHSAAGRQHRPDDPPGYRLSGGQLAAGILPQRRAHAARARLLVHRRRTARRRRPPKPHVAAQPMSPGPANACVRRSWGHVVAPGTKWWQHAHTRAHLSPKLRDPTHANSRDNSRQAAFNSCHLESTPDSSPCIAVSGIGW